jgi:hypothetical protein
MRSLKKKRNNGEDSKIDLCSSSLLLKASVLRIKGPITANVRAIEIAGSTSSRREYLSLV